MTQTDERTEVQRALLTRLGWADGEITPLTADASTRRYFRLTSGKGTALLMDAPPAAEAPVCPPDADDMTRRALGYNAKARLAAGRLEAFVGIADWLRERDIPAPAVFGYDAQAGLAVIEDFGGRHLKDSPPKDEERHYRAAAALLRRLRSAALVPAMVIGDWPLLSYDALALASEADLLTEWYLPHYADAIGPKAAEDWTQAWAETLDRLSVPRTLVLRDYHAENILIRPDGLLGVIDFQDALVGQSAYDLVSLLEDARRDVDLGFADEVAAEEAAQSDDPAQFLTDYAILAAQRNMKILGVFARLIHRDKKLKYAEFFPRVARHVARDLTRDAVGPIRAWSERYAPVLLQGPQ